MILGGALGGFWFFSGTTSLDRRLWLHHVRNGFGIGCSTCATVSTTMRTWAYLPDA